MSSSPFTMRPDFAWQLRSRVLSLGRTTRVMGVLNATPDSFSDGGRLRSPEAAVDAALAMFAAGAAIVDVGGESTRPGVRLTLESTEEQDRVLPVIEGVLRAIPGAVLSCDTYRGATARAALRAGVEIINDVSGFLWDPEMASVCAAEQCGVVLMHTRGRPEEWRSLPPLAASEVLPLVRRELSERLRAATLAGIAPQRVVLDPGFGFGKAFDNNYPLLAGLRELRSLGHPLLAGVSRKAFLGRTLRPLYGGVDAPPEARGPATLAAVTAAILAGAEIVRVHDVRPAVEAAAIADAVLDGAGGAF